MSNCTPLLVSVTVVTLCLSIVLIQEVRVLKTDLKGIKRDLLSPLVHRSLKEFGYGLFMSNMWEQHSFVRPRNRHEEDVWTNQASFLQMAAMVNEKPIQRGNVTVIPWTVSIQQGSAVTASDNKIVVQQDSYFMVFGQVLYHDRGAIMGHLIRQQPSSASGGVGRYRDLFRCLQEMPGEENSANTCYTAGIVKLEHNDQLELVIPDRPHAQVAMDTESTFFGIIQLQ
ncbi:tumor necrosis factor ligand superfamily member 13B-like isoform X1 [Alosa sapidissima]|uniref:tumor necrosis factor ligand superfamily member 13B-like isoform X1 n=1 Tax=Alosa sapidissima TaxID=34773 RepID=UPI001C09F4B4|nr:tumor necrosis factor ligand superfamily member 13B-like isoform X1 [Alosa sapidissima]